jgi:CubicO group peptidase (beta-lactamase class C family)
MVSRKPVHRREQCVRRFVWSQARRLAVVDFADRLAAVRDLLGRLVAQNGLPGAAIAVAVDGERVFDHYEGDAAPGRTAAADTLWDLASIGKAYTAATITALVERGELTFSRPVAAVLPECTGGDRERITLRHLLTHTAGLDDDAPEVARLRAANAPLEAIVDAALRTPLRFAPGTDRRYGGLGSAVAAQVAVRATGTPFPDLLRTLVLEPGELHDTFRPPPLSEANRLAHVAGVPGADPFEAIDPAADVRATVRDLLRFGLLFAPGGPRVLSEAGVRMMTTDQTGRDFYDTADNDTIYAQAIGFVLKGRPGLRELAGARVFGHLGSTGCLLWVDPAERVVGAFVSNLEVGLDDIYFRLDRVANVTTAALTRRH